MPELNLKQILFCITADHATPCGLKIHSDTPVPLLISGNNLTGEQSSGFSEKNCAKGSLGILVNAQTYTDDEGTKIVYT